MGSFLDYQTTVNVTGDKELDAVLTEICMEDGPKAIKAAMRRSLRIVTKEILLPAVLAEMQDDLNTGFLRSQIVVRAIRRSRRFIGFHVGFPDQLYTGDTFYGGFGEFGTKERFKKSTGQSVGLIEEDSYLRKPLYRLADVIRARVIQQMSHWYDEVNCVEINDVEAGAEL